ncbi:MAG: class I SAM-dependent methyltransferase [Actinomycetota bacterium]|nr:class I SAM-dependent methyltransferase [Actinomycetota bacterium]
MPEHLDFDALYRTDADPFQVSSSWYERRKIDVVLASLSQARYELAWDCACGTGHLAAALAPRCRRMLATDASAEAVRLSSRTTAELENVECELAALPDVPPAAGRASLVVVSEVLYYLDDQTRAASYQAIASVAQEMVVVHWRHHPADTFLSGARATAECVEAMSALGWSASVRHEEPDFVLATLHRAAPGNAGNPDSCGKEPVDVA